MAKLGFRELAKKPEVDEKNTFKLYCPYDSCNSLILSPGFGVLKHRASIPKRIAEEKSSSDKVDNVNMQSQDTRENTDEGLFWILSDPFDFDNLGFSKSSADGVKYLACADCDRGPLGYHDSNHTSTDTSTGKEYLLDATLILYKMSS
ncbi:Mss4-like protein [Dipodascopsis uninucleata]